jgi:hypothetical protein
MLNGKLQEFACTVIAKGQIGYGDVRRLQRDCLPGGIADRDEAELMIALNAKLVRADKAWAQWLVAAVTGFVADGEEGGRPGKECSGDWIERVLAAPTTRLGRRIARQVQRELERRGFQSANADKPQPQGTVGQAPDRPSRARTPKHARRDRSQRTAKPRCASGKRPIAATAAFANAGHGWCLAGYLPAVHRSHFMNFPNSRASLVLAPYR